MRFENGNWIFLAVTAAVLLAGVAVFPPCPVWITDNGSKYIIMRNFERSGSVALRHALPDCAPEGGFHIQRHKGELRSFYPEYYPVLCSLFYSEKSERAAAVPAVFGTLLCAYIMLKWFRSRYLAFLLVAGTALLFYTFTLWEMTLSCA
ncbi:MAG: hypothetical protein J6Q80_03525, partial [Lentisphaeria bacterium]|nr:hypothetical protein [Lentisphaeria bacterium]